MEEKKNNVARRGRVGQLVVDDKPWNAEEMEEQTITKHCPQGGCPGGGGCPGRGCPVEGYKGKELGLMWGNEENGEVSRKRNAVKQRKSFKIKEMTAGEGRRVMLEKNDIWEVKNKAGRKDDGEAG